MFCSRPGVRSVTRYWALLREESIRIVKKNYCGRGNLSVCIAANPSPRRERNTARIVRRQSKGRNYPVLIRLRESFSIAVL